MASNLELLQKALLELNTQKDTVATKIKCKDKGAIFEDSIDLILAELRLLVDYKEFDALIKNLENKQDLNLAKFNSYIAKLEHLLTKKIEKEKSKHSDYNLSTVAKNILNDPKNEIGHYGAATASYLYQGSKSVIVGSAVAGVTGFVLWQYVIPSVGAYLGEYITGTVFPSTLNAGSGVAYKTGEYITETVLPSAMTKGADVAYKASEYGSQVFIPWATSKANEYIPATLNAGSDVASKASEYITETIIPSAMTKGADVASKASEYGSQVFIPWATSKVNEYIPEPISDSIGLFGTAYNVTGSIFSSDDFKYISPYLATLAKSFLTAAICLAPVVACLRILSKVSNLANEWIIKPTKDSLEFGASMISGTFSVAKTAFSVAKTAFSFVSMVVGGLVAGAKALFDATALTRFFIGYRAKKHLVPAVKSLASAPVQVAKTTWSYTAQPVIDNVASPIYNSGKNAMAFAYNGCRRKSLVMETPSSNGHKPTLKG